MAKNNKTRFFYGPYSDKLWLFDKSECAPGLIDIIIFDKTRNTNKEEVY